MTQLITKDDEIREYHLKRLFYLSHKSVGQKPQLEEPNEEQKDWIERKMKGRFV
jgi:hypothetical protein